MNSVDIWDKILIHISKNVHKSIFENWFQNTKCVGTGEDGRLIVEVPSAFSGDWLEQVYGEKIKTALKEIGHPDLQIIFRPRTPPTDDEITELKKKKIKEIPKKIKNSFCAQFSSRYTFDNFVVGKSNQMAFISAKAVSENPAKTYNPLFIYGGVGLGKTHLLHAIGNASSDNHSVLYTSAESIMNEIVSALQKNKMTDFKNKYRKVDILLIDDIHFLQDKKVLQEELFHIFNTLYNSYKQIVLTADRPPWEVKNVEERLVSRFQGGLVVDIKPPDFETRVAILTLKAKKESVEIPHDVLYFIASKIKRNIRQLEGCLIRLSAYHSMTKTPIDLESTKELLKDILESGNESTPHEVLDVVSNYFNIPKEALLDEKRTRETVRSRQIAMYILRNYYKIPLKQIGQILKGKDHSTVIYGIEKIENLLKRDKELQSQIEEIMLKIKLL